MYSKEQKDIALRIYHQTESVLIEIKVIELYKKSSLWNCEDISSSYP